MLEIKNGAFIENKRAISLNYSCNQNGCKTEYFIVEYKPPRNVCLVPKQEKNKCFSHVKQAFILSNFFIHLFYICM